MSARVADRHGPCMHGLPRLPQPCGRTPPLIRACGAEFVGCSPSLSGALRVNPWSITSIADGIYAAIKTPVAEQVRPRPPPPMPRLPVLALRARYALLWTSLPTLSCLDPRRTLFSG